MSNNRLDKAIAAFEDETLDLTLGERISGIRAALLHNVLNLIKRSNKTGKKSEAEKEEESKHIECMEWFKDVEKLYSAQVKMNKLTGKSTDNDKDFLKQIKEQKSSIGNIVRDLSKN